MPTGWCVDRRAGGWTGCGTWTMLVFHLEGQSQARFQAISSALPCDFLKHLFLSLLLVRGQRHGPCIKVRGKLVSVLCPPYGSWAPGHQTQVVRLGSKHPHPLGQLPGSAIHQNFCSFLLLWFEWEMSFTDSGT